MLRKRTSKQLTPLELEIIMNVLWENAPATVRAVRERLPGKRKLAYATVQTMLGVLLRKGKVRRHPKGRSFEYEPRISRSSAERVALQDIVERVFGGSVESLLTSLAESSNLRRKGRIDLNHQGQGGGNGAGEGCLQGGAITF